MPAFVWGLAGGGKMYKILVAEDSKPIMRDIVRLIRKENEDISIETAYDGEEALEMIEKFEPDIIFTDIKMPVMDGLTLIQKAKKICPSVKCVIISGYTDFTFTHEALVLQVDDYVMKPVDEEQFKKLMLRLLKEIDDLRICRTESVMQQILQEEKLIPEKSLPNRYSLSLVRVGIFQQYAAPLSRELVSEVQKEVRVSGRVWIINTKLNSEKLIVYDREDDIPEERIMLWNRKMLEKLREKYTRVNIICSGEREEIGNLGRQYTELSNQLGRKVMLDEVNVFKERSGAEDHREYIRQREEMDLFRTRMGRILKNRSEEDYQKEITRRIKDWKKMQYPVVVLRKFLTALLDEMLIAEAGNARFAEEPGTLADRLINDCASYGELEKHLLEYGDYMTETREERPGASVEMAQELVEYMRINVYKNLSLQDMAQHFDISSSYICRLFKMYYSDTPISYYNRIKIEEARTMLTDYPNMRVKDIAEMLGFSDQYYFSKVFKQQYGVSPLVYRSQIYGHGE